jgi:peroxiredoxin
MIETGAPAPDVVLISQDLQHWRTEHLLRGARACLLSFYPFDWTDT